MRTLTTIAGLTVSAALAGALPLQAAPVPDQQLDVLRGLAADATQVRTERSTGGYDVIVDGVRRATVPVSDPAYTVRATVSPDDRYTAAIRDFDGAKGTELLLIDAAGRSKAVASGSITSATFSSSGALAYLADGQVFVTDWAASRAPKAAGRIDGRDPALLGWTSNGRSLLAVQHPDVQHEGTYTATLSRFEPSTGAVQPLLASDPERSAYYSDLRLVQVNGVQHISFILGSDLYRCDGGTSTIGLATEDGRVVEQLATSTAHYRRALWSPDGSSIAYEQMGCVTKEQKAADRSAALRWLDEVNGVYVLDRASGQSRRVVRGLSYTHPLTGFTGKAVLVGSEFYGTRTLDAHRSDAASADDLDAAAAAPEGTQSIQGRTNTAEYIHQLWDTRDGFHGGASCGPTSAVIDLVTYQLKNEYGVWVSSPSRHWSKWGRYVTDEYTAYGTTFNRASPDARVTGSWKGAHGWIVGWHCENNTKLCAGWAQETDYLRRNGASVTQGLYDANWVRARLNEGKFVIMSGTYGSTLGHLSVVVGYTDDGRWIVHDTYGAGTDASYDGRYVVYTWNYIAPKQMWAA